MQHKPDAIVFVNACEDWPRLIMELKASSHPGESDTRDV
jgi:hypothetical protein